jgi:hypothetical protein
MSRPAEARANERNRLRADIENGRLMHQAEHQARLCYCFVPNAYSYECLGAVLRLKHQLNRILRSDSAEDQPQPSISAQPNEGVACQVQN